MRYRLLFYGLLIVVVTSPVSAFSLFNNLCFPLANGTPCINWTGSTYTFTGLTFPELLFYDNITALQTSNNTVFNQLSAIKTVDNTQNNTLSSLSNELTAASLLAQNKALTGYTGFCAYGIAGLTANNDTAPNVTCANAPVIPTTGNITSTNGTAGYFARFTNSTNINTGTIYDDGTNIGIGTNAPSFPLTISSASASAKLLNLERQGVGGLLVYGTGGTPNAVTFTANSTTGATESMFIATSTGNGFERGDVAFGSRDTTPALAIDVSTERVGINTSTPSSALTVVGNAEIVSGSNPGGLTINNTFAGQGRTISVVRPGVGGMYLTSAGGTVAAANLGAISSSGSIANSISLYAQSSGGYGFADTTIGLTGAATPNPTFYVPNNRSQVGIGTNQPNSTLTVIGNASISDRFAAPEICLNGDCKTAWPTSGGGGNRSLGMEDPEFFFTLREDFMHNTGTQGFSFLGGAVVSSGTTTTFAPDTANTVGAQTISDSTTIDGGYLFRTATSTLILAGGEEGLFRIRMNPAAKAGRTTASIGFIDTATVAQSVDGCYFRYMADENGTRVWGECSNNSVRTNTSTMYTATNNTWYVYNVSVNGGGTPANTFTNFTITNGTGVVLWTANVSGNIPLAVGRDTGFGFIATQSTTDAASVIAHIDYAYLNIRRFLNRY